MEKLRHLLIENKLAQSAEIAVVFLVAIAITFVGWQWVGDGIMARQAVVWLANVAMLLMIWWGLRLRNQSWAHFGLAWGFPGWRRLLANVVKSVAVFFSAMIAFVAGAWCVPNLTGNVQQADMSSYDWLRGNLPMLLLALAAVYVVSSFGEEVVYRGFLINRFAELGNGTMPANVAAVVASAVIFGLAHFDWGLVGIVQTTFMGLALAGSYLLVQQRLWVLVLAHSYLDTLLLAEIYLSPATS